LEISSFLAGPLLFDKKNRQSIAQAVFPTLLGDPKLSLNMKCRVPAFFGDRLGRKEGGLCPYKPSSKELGGKIDFCFMTSNSTKYSKLK
jgi:hypothetical protein